MTIRELWLLLRNKPVKFRFANMSMENTPPQVLPWGINTIGSPYHPDVHAGLPDGRYVHAVCEPHDMGRFRAAWWVLTGRAYAFLWPKAGELEGIWQRLNPPVLRTSPRPFVPQADSRGPSVTRPHLSTPEK